MKSSAIILSGGRGRRAGGADKGLLPWREHTRIEAVIATIVPQVDEILISANRNLEHYRQFGFAVISDELEGFQGPLAGLSSVLPRCLGETVFVVPCDTPMLPADLCSRLSAPLHKAALDLCLVNDGDYLQYLLLALKPRCLQTLRDYLDEGGRSVRGWLPRLRYESVYFSDQPAAFANLNETG